MGLGGVKALIRMLETGKNPLALGDTLMISSVGEGKRLITRNENHHGPPGLSPDEVELPSSAPIAQALAGRYKAENERGTRGAGEKRSRLFRRMVPGRKKGAIR